MPYCANADLPPRVRNVLPPHAQDIYLLLCIGDIRLDLLIALVALMQDRIELQPRYVENGRQVR